MATIKMETYLECICAVHLSHYVDSPFKSRGGLMVIGPPGQLKTTMIGILEQYPDAVPTSDLNNMTLASLREGMTAGTLNTIIIPELRKLYQHHPSTTSNMEGTLQAMVDEGFSQPSFRDSRMQGTKARCSIIGALTEGFYQKQFSAWGETGFSRRFLWSLISLENNDILTKAVNEWRAIDIGLEKMPTIPPTEHISSNLVSEKERNLMHVMIKYQPGNARSTQHQLLCKMLAVLRWHYKRKKISKDPVKAIIEFGASLGKEGARIVL